MRPSQAHRAVEAVWRMEAPRVIGALVRITGDVALAEDLAQDALVAALESWPESGIPDNPGAWLTAAARRRAIDVHRREAMHREKHDVIRRRHAIAHDPFDGMLDALDDPVGDDVLRLIFACCHPSLPKEARVALTLRLLGGLTTEEIARAFIVPAATVAQRIVRAKRTLREAGVSFEVPHQAILDARLASVIEVVYLIFNEGHTATRGDDWVRPVLCEEALRLGRILAGLMPDEGEVHGLVALMEIQASRLRTRVDGAGHPILLPDQDRARWDWVLVRRGLAALGKAEAPGTAPGPYVLQAAIAACHARARTYQETDWHRIVALYDLLLALVPTPIVALNRAVAVSMARGAEAGLVVVEALVADGALDRYHPLFAVRGELLRRLERYDAARRAFERAAAMAGNAREEALLRERATACESLIDPST